VFVTVAVSVLVAVARIVRGTCWRRCWLATSYVGW